MGLIFSFFAVISLIVIVFIGVNAANLHYLFGVVIPYAAFLTFILGVIYRVLKWARVPVPFRIPTTAGQEKSLPWIKQNKIDNPSTSLGVVIRMAMEVFLFRSLFRNTKMELRDGPKISYGSTKWLWLGGLAFHYTFLIILTRHLRLFMEPVPVLIKIIESLDGFFQVGAPVLVSDRFVLYRRGDFSFPSEGCCPAVKIYISCSGLFPVVSDMRNRPFRYHHEIFPEDRCRGREGIDDGSGYL